MNKIHLIIICLLVAILALSVGSLVLLYRIDHRDELTEELGSEIRRFTELLDQLEKRLSEKEELIYHDEKLIEYMERIDMTLIEIENQLVETSTSGTVTPE